MRHRAAQLLVALTIAFDRPAWAADQVELVGPSDEVWAAWTAHAIDSVRVAFERRKSSQSARKEADSQETTKHDKAKAQDDGRHSSYVAVREPSLEPETAASSLDRLTLGLKTDVADAEAGVSVSPAILFGSSAERGRRPLDGLSLIVATLKDDKTRVGAKWAWASTATPGSLDDVGLAPCALDEAKLRQFISDLRSHFESACSVLLASVPVRPSEAQDAVPWDEARAACGAEPGEAPRTLTQARSALVTAIEKGRAHATAEQLQALERVAPSLDQIDYRKHPLPFATACYDARELRLAFRRAQWRQTKIGVGVLSTADFYPRITGFNPDPARPLPHGQNAAWLIQTEGSIEKNGFNLVGSVGWARTRKAFGEDLHTSIRPSLSASFVVSRLDGQPLRRNGVLTFRDDGSIPPLLVAGFSAKIDYAKTRPDSQESALNSAEFQLFLDFRVTEKLSFRLGVPYRGELAVRKADSKADPPITEGRDLQWTLPVFVATVIKL